MASSVYYKFKAQKAESRVTFDGTGISVFDLKREIIIGNKMGKGTDFDLGIYDSNTEKEYTNDNEIIPRSTLVIVRRLPASRPGKGKAQTYLAGLPSSTPGGDSRVEPPAQDRPALRNPGVAWNRGYGSMSARFDGKDVGTSRKSSLTTAQDKPADFDKSGEPEELDPEQAAIQAMFQATSEQWEKTQEKMSQATPIYNHRGGPRKFPLQPHQPLHQPQQFPQSERPPPAGYTCYRCGQKGHWIQDCPTNGDQEFDNRPRIKRTTGIPRSFLKAVDNPNGGAPVQGVMVTPEGGYVVAQPDSLSWEKQRAKQKSLTEADIRERPCTDLDLICPLDSKLFREAVKTPCCSTTYCEECIQTYLLEQRADFVCPNCEKKIESLDKLTADKEIRARVKEYITTAIEESKEDSPPRDVVSNLASKEPSNVATPEPDRGNSPTPAAPDYFAQIQSHEDNMRQIVSMMTNPNLTPQARAQLQKQMQEISNQISQLQILISMSNLGPMAAMGNMNGMGSMNGMNGMDGTTMNGMNGMHGMNNAQMNGMMNEMMNGMMMNGFDPSFNGGGWGGYGADWNSGFQNQQSMMGDSAYQRLPMNNRRRGGFKRERPQDFLEVESRPGNKVARYYE